MNAEYIKDCYLYSKYIGIIPLIVFILEFHTLVFLSTVCKRLSLPTNVCLLYLNFHLCNSHSSLFHPVSRFLLLQTIFCTFNPYFIYGHETFIIKKQQSVLLSLKSYLVNNFLVYSLLSLNFYYCY